ncbi:hypothetical protein BO82DRAFT_429277 [Aspergillus uvarum CBS 121591]|uniref:Cytochrome P450 n=1 Tax=Aspergillus uvarum CBS 121591 TaxID=1448315 RepID=A0A319CQK5_9EURO|nr:hypothetical protein BO82DRAFT_429277 [Aspergillus uvarum CBS 121591]PYH85237.1 hypothetical protein BO82DRAFT_429277 [Aspergillus uvarum CBS 121591]
MLTFTTVAPVAVILIMDRATAPTSSSTSSTALWSELRLTKPLLSAQQQIYATEAIKRDTQRFVRFLEGKQDIANYDHESDHRRFRKAIYQAVTGPAFLTHQAVIRRNTSVFRKRLDAVVVQGNGEGRVDMTKLYSWFMLDLAGNLIWRELFGCLQNMESHPRLAAMGFMTFGTYFRLVGVSPLLQKLTRSVIPKRIRDYPRRESVFSIMRQRKTLSPTEMDANLMVLGVASSVTVHSAVLTATAFLAVHKQCEYRAPSGDKVEDYNFV